jgi:hypothetical protein
VSKEDCGAAVEHVLRPGEALHVRAGAGAGGTRGGSGGGGAMWRGRERPARGREGGGKGAGGHVAQLRAARGRPVRGTWLARAAGVGRRETEEEGTRDRRRGICLQFPESVGCGRTNLNYTGSSTRVHSRGLQYTSNCIIPWPVG